MKKGKWMMRLLLMAISIKSYGQISKADSVSNTPGKVIYFFSIQSGALAGDQVTFSASTLHGAKLGKRLRVGAGVGFDSFEDAQTLPVFGSASWDVFGKKNVVFVQLNYGWAPFAWSPALKDTYGFKKVEGGEMFSALIGYRIAYGDLRLAIAAGYRHQQINIYYENQYYYPWYSYLPSAASPVSSQLLSESLNRFAIIMSVGWR